MESVLGQIGRPFLNLFESLERFGVFILFQIRLFRLYPKVFKRPNHFIDSNRYYRIWLYWCRNTYWGIYWNGRSDSALQRISSIWN